MKLFQSIFGGESQGRYPESLVEMAIERAVDGTDPRMRAMPGYRKQLRAPVLHAIDHVVTLVDSLPAPLAADRGTYSGDARLRALFASADRMLEVFGNDSVLNEFRAAAKDAGRINALLLAERVEKNVLGVELSGDMLRRDVAQVAVSFRGHRLVDPTTSADETRRLLKRRAFDHLLSLALARIIDVKGERAGLNQQRDVLKHKLNALQHGGWGFDDAGEGTPDPGALQGELADIEAQLAGLHADADALRAHLHITAELLADAERQFWGEVIELRLDRMNIQREEADTSAQLIRFQELRNARGRRLVMLFLSMTLDELPRREDFFTAAERYTR
ncbi:MAG: hypothetical protein J5I92_05630 [Thiogranum sp.]|nr:hypothetical protein [Thiogranum sp.]